MKVSEIRNLDVGELQKRLEAAREELFNSRFRLATKQLVNHRELPRLKKDIARFNTVLREKELGIR